MRELQVVMVRLASDPDFRAQFGEDADAILAAYHLTESERQLLLRCRPLLALSPQALHERWVLSPTTEGPIWWDSMSEQHVFGV